MSLFNPNRWRTYLQILSGKKRESSIRASLIRGTGGTFLVRIGHTGLLLSTALLFARLMGAEDYGTYAYVMAWITMLLIPALFGIDTLLVRQIAVYNVHSEWALMKGITQCSVVAILVTSTILAIAGAAVAVMIPAVIDPGHLATFWTALVLLPLLALMRIQNGIMRGLHAVVRAQAPEFVIFPGALVLLVIAAHYLLDASITPHIAIVLTVACAAAASIISTRWLWRLVPAPSREALPRWQVRLWLRSALPLVFIAGMGVINNRMDILMIGAMLDHKTAGIYAVAAQLSTLVAFILIAVNSALAPVIARLYSTGEKARLQSVITRSTRLMLAGALPAALVLIVFGHWILLLFGAEFPAGLTSLRLLVLGQIVNVTAGSVGWLLVMTGHERDAAIGISLGAIVNICLNAVLIPIWGAAGAAAATAISMALWNILLVTFVFKRLGIYSFAFSAPDTDTAG